MTTARGTAARLPRPRTLTVRLTTAEWQALHELAARLEIGVGALATSSLAVLREDDE